MKAGTRSALLNNFLSIQRETRSCQEALRTRWTDPTDFPRTRTISLRHWGRSQQLLSLERRREKELLKRRGLSVALYRARQVMRREQADLRFKEAVEMGAPFSIHGPPPPTRAPTLEKLRDGRMERVEDLQGRADIVHDHFKELFTDPLHKETPEWIWQRLAWEVQSLPIIDSQDKRKLLHSVFSSNC